MAKYLQSGQFKHLFLLSIGIAVGMMTKGPLILVVLFAAFGSQFLIKKQWRNIFKAQWLLLFLFVAILLFPMCWGLYTQFDLHPEKSAYGIDSPSGLKFFFWTQSFGRITGESSWENGQGFFYFFHTILWDFQPWIWFFIPALFSQIKDFILCLFSKMKSKNEYITLMGFVLIFISLSSSQYKLPHYIFSIFPFAAIITAHFMNGFSKKLNTKASKIQFGILHVFWIAMGVLLTFVFPHKNLYLFFVLGIGYYLFVHLFIKLKDSKERLFIPSIVTALFFNLIMAVHFYPNLLTYQSSTIAGRHIAKNNLDIHSYNINHHALNFYAKKLIKPYSSEEIKNAPSGQFIYTDEEGYDQIKTQRATKLVKTFPYFKATQISLPFLNHSTREEVLKKTFIIELN